MLSQIQPWLGPFLQGTLGPSQPPSWGGEGARGRGPHLRRCSPATGDCGPPPAMTHSRPSSDEHSSSFPVGSRVTFTCAEGARKIPGLPDTMECLPGNLWSRLPDPCGRKYPPFSETQPGLTSLSLLVPAVPVPRDKPQTRCPSEPLVAAGAGRGVSWGVELGSCAPPACACAPHVLLTPSPSS